MIDIAHEGVQQAKDKGEYKNHTYNLRSAPGAAVVLDGKIEDMYVPAETGHNEAKEKRKIFCFTAIDPKTVLCWLMAWNMRLL